MVMNKQKPGKPVTHPPVICEETGQIFKTYKAAAESIGGSRPNVYRCCIGIQKQHKGYHFKLKEEEE